jgi:hypothetical protein
MDVVRNLLAQIIQDGRGRQIGNIVHLIVAYLELVRQKLPITTRFYRFLGKTTDAIVSTQHMLPIWQ